MGLRVRLRWAMVSGAAAFAAALYWQRFTFGQSLVVGVAVGILVQTTLSTVERLRSLYRRD